MQIREKGNKILLIKTQYVPEKKRTVGKTVLSFDSYIDSIDRLPEDGLSTLTDEDRLQLEQYFADQKAKHDSVMSRLAVTGAVEKLSSIAEAMKDSDLMSEHVDSTKAGLLYQQMDAIAKQLRAAGYKKKDVLPKADSGSKKDDSTIDMLESN